VKVLTKAAKHKTQKIKTIAPIILKPFISKKIAAKKLMTPHIKLYNLA
jgi:hypothetical protein